MKTKVFALIFILAAFMNSSLKAQNKAADRILGYFLTYDDDTKAEKSQVQIFKASDNKYYGKIVWLKEPNKDGKPKVDDKNPDKKLSSRPVLGLLILTGFDYNDKDGEWSDGKIYDPQSGKTYRCILKFESENKLKVRGYIGAAFIGKTVYWTKESALRK